MKTEIVVLLHCVYACAIFGAHQDGVAAGSRVSSASRFQNEAVGVLPDSDAVASSSDSVDDVIDAADRLKRTMGMLRMGRSQQTDGDYVDAEDQFTDDKRTMGMLRMGKRTMGMLRMGRGGSENFESGNYEAQQQLAADNKRTMGMLRMGRSDKVDKKTMSMLRMG